MPKEYNSYNVQENFKVSSSKEFDIAFLNKENKTSKPKTLTKTKNCMRKK